MTNVLWRVARLAGYRRGMDKPQRVEPERLPDEVMAWEGHWVAVKDGAVIEAALNPEDLVVKVQQLGEAGRGAVSRYVPRRSDVIVMGMG
jgi:hypothetical protein